MPAAPLIRRQIVSVAPQDLKPFAHVAMDTEARRRHALIGMAIDRQAERDVADRPAVLEQPDDEIQIAQLWHVGRKPAELNERTFANGAGRNLPPAAADKR